MKVRTVMSLFTYMIKIVRWKREGGMHESTLSLLIIIIDPILVCISMFIGSDPPDLISLDLQLSES